jgi:putative phosphoribosyl transferase
MTEHLIKIALNEVELEGMLTIPEQTTGLVLFSHGSGSSRLSPRNNYVARVLQRSNIATLLIDLLTHEEDENYATRFDIALLTHRLIKIIHWLQKETATQSLAIGLFGASTGAAAALEVAAKLGTDITAVVSRGGRPDLAMDVLHTVLAPTLLIVGGNDFGVIELNEQAFQRLTCTKKLEIVEDATHLFEEEGALEKVAIFAKNWFQHYLHEK